MLSYTSAEIESWDRLYRANFVNSLAGFKSVNLIGTSNKSGLTNLGIFSSVVHIGSNPALIGYINRPLASAPHTLANIQSSGEYTINHINAAIMAQAHQTSAKYDAGISEFDQVGLTAEFAPGFTAPFVRESFVKYGLILQQIIPITLNNTFLVIGKLQYVFIDKDILADDGFLQLDKANGISSNGVDAYYSPVLRNRYEYAKPDVALKSLPDSKGNQ